MVEWSVDTPWGVTTPYSLIVAGRWRLSAAIGGVFLSEYVTCPMCQNQRGLTFKTDSSRLGEMVDIICPRPCDALFQIPEILGFDLQQRLFQLDGLDVDPAWMQAILAEDPTRPSGPLPADDEPDEKPGPTPPAPAQEAAARADTPRMRTTQRPAPRIRGRRQTHNQGVTVGPGQTVTGPVQAAAGAGDNASARRVQRDVAAGLADAIRPAPGTRVIRNDTVLNTGRMSRLVSTNTVVVTGNNQQVNVRNGRVSVDGGPAEPASRGRVPRKVAARARRAARETEQAVRASGGRSSSTVHVSGDNNSVITSTTDGDTLHVTGSE
ncbi:hypothetical protein [Streptomyces chartreusis]|uniref:hypothetical protein n=1 Tax=Streptomyces chartreusis TaxID=1969 RepID=UPI0037F3092C